MPDAGRGDDAAAMAVGQHLLDDRFLFTLHELVAAVPQIVVIRVAALHFGADGEVGAVGQVSKAGFGVAAAEFPRGIRH